ncbi:hypothetical protein [uncultured Dokdonia sp.]|uniref:hypothetical protein n=1 Tax=uncultured Dokdonia sp. TaxID=575653 RepID=UPI00261E76F1|nr:hypothetical protein [uncultured Dokdonia sp.]
MNTQTVTASDFPTKITSFKAIKGTRILNSTLGANKVTSSFLPNPFDVSVTKRKGVPAITFNFKVYIDANNTSQLYFKVDKTSTKFCLEYDHAEETPEYVYEYTIMAEYGCSTLHEDSEVTLYLMDTDPITSSGKKVIVHPPA